ELAGPLLVGPVEAVNDGGHSVTILGRVLNLNKPIAELLPAQYVAVFGVLSSDDSVTVGSVEVLDEVYAPGSSMVLYAGVISAKARGTGSATIGEASVDGLSLPGFEGWVKSHKNELAVVFG